MAGNAWDMTSVFEDDHTRSVILRGSSNYRPSGSHWYFPLTPSFLGQHEKCECERLAPFFSLVALVALAVAACARTLLSDMVGL